MPPPFNLAPKPIRPSVADLCADLFSGPGRPCNIAAELRRSVDLEEWLEELDPGLVVSKRIPRVDKTLISVIVPMFNASTWIETTLKSLLVQHENIEIFCVDDASTDDTYDRVTSRFGADGRVCAVRLGRHVGAYQIRNWVAARLARGEWLAFQDADDLSHPNRFSLQKEYLQTLGLNACGSCTHQVFPGNITPKRSDTEAWEHRGLFHSLVFYSNVPRAVEAKPLRHLLLDRAPTIYCRNGSTVRQVPVSDSPALYPTLMIRRATFLSFGGFEGRATVLADATFVMKLARFQAIANTPAILYTRRIHSRSLTQRPETGYSSSLRLTQRRARKEVEQQICRAISGGDWPEALRLCTSDLYHADISVAEWQARFTIPSALK